MKKAFKMKNLVEVATFTLVHSCEMNIAKKIKICYKIKAKSSKLDETR